MKQVSQWFVVMVLAMSASLFAQQPNDNVRAARLSFVQGTVTVNGGGDSLPGTINMPITEGQQIVTGDDGQAEVEFEDGSVVRLTPVSSVVMNLMSYDGNTMQTDIGLQGGMFYLDLRVADGVRYTVDALGERILPQENSVVRVRMDEPPAEVGVLEGQVQVMRDGGFNATVKGGESLRGDAEDVNRYYLQSGIEQDTWDDWNEQREQQAANDANMRTDAQTDADAQAGYGWADLDAYGNWYDIPGEGQVWQPEQASDPGFDPYGYGSWVYYPTSGYVWVSSYPWGWTPFRCGNWNYYNNFGWGWQSTGCGIGGGWGGWGGVYVRVQHPPRGYHFPIRPTPGRGNGWSGGRPPRRVIPIGTRPPISPRVPSREGRPVNIGGQTLKPLPRRGGYTQRGGSAVGSGLRRDFLVNRKSKHPEMGVAPAQPQPAIVPGAGWKQVDNRRGSAPANGQQQGRPGASTAPNHDQHNNQQQNQNGGSVINGRVPSANPPMQRRGEDRLQVRRPDGSVIQPGQNNDQQRNENRPTRPGFNGRPATPQQPVRPVARPEVTQPAPQQQQNDQQRQQMMEQMRQRQEQQRQQLQQRTQEQQQQRQLQEQQRQVQQQQQRQQQMLQRQEQMRQQRQVERPALQSRPSPPQPQSRPAPAPRSIPSPFQRH